MSNFNLGAMQRMTNQGCRYAARREEMLEMNNFREDSVGFLGVDGWLLAFDGGIFFLGKNNTCRIKD